MSRDGGIHFNVLLMYSRPWQIENEKTKVIENEGVSVEFYFFGKNGEQLAPVADESGNLGIRRSKGTLDILAKDKLMFVPGIYDGLFEMAVGSDGKPVLKLLDIDFVGKCNMSLEPATPFNPDASAETPADVPADGKSKK